MSYRVPPDVEQLVSEQMRQGSYASEDDVLRDALNALAERNADLAAIRAGTEDMEAGRTKPLRDVDAEIRRNLGFPPSQ
ncbi:MAG: type II toxin-antitoxin system ParD family antitoxin [Pirellulales bacterium]